MSTPDALRLAAELENGDTYESHSAPVYGWCDADPCQDAADELRRQHAEIERMRADAARYRWLTHDGERIGERMRGTLDAWDGCDGKAGFDVAIDAAMRDAPQRLNQPATRLRGVRLSEC